MNEKSNEQANQPPVTPEPTVKAVPTVAMPQKSHKGGFPIKTFLLILILALITVGLVTLALLPKKTAPTPAPIAKITPNPVQTTLTISSTPVAEATPSAYKTDVIVNTGQNNITSVQLELVFDPKVLTKVDIQPGSFFINPVVALKNIDIETGRITYVISPADGAGVLGQGILAKISFSVVPEKKGVPTTIDFLPKTQVNAEETTESVLKLSVGAKFTLGTVPTLIVSPTATPSAQ